MKPIVNKAPHEMLEKRAMLPAHVYHRRIADVCVWGEHLHRFLCRSRPFCEASVREHTCTLGDVTFAHLHVFVYDC